MMLMWCCALIGERNGHDVFAPSVGRPLAERRCRLDRDAALSLELHRVHLGADAVLTLHLVNGVDTRRVIEDAFGQRRLAAIDVGRDADVPDFGQVGQHKSA